MKSLISSTEASILPGVLSLCWIRIGSLSKKKRSQNLSKHRLPNILPFPKVFRESLVLLVVFHSVSIKNWYFNKKFSSILFLKFGFLVWSVVFSSVVTLRNQRGFSSRFLFWTGHIQFSDENSVSLLISFSSLKYGGCVNKSLYSVSLAGKALNRSVPVSVI